MNFFREQVELGAGLPRLCGAFFSRPTFIYAQLKSGAAPLRGAKIWRSALCGAKICQITSRAVRAIAKILKSADLYNHNHNHDHR